MIKTYENHLKKTVMLHPTGGSPLLRIWMPRAPRIQPVSGLSLWPIVARTWQMTRWVEDGQIMGNICGKYGRLSLYSEILCIYTIMILIYCIHNINKDRSLAIRSGKLDGKIMGEYGLVTIIGIGFREKSTGHLLVFWEFLGA